MSHVSQSMKSHKRRPDPAQPNNARRHHDSRKGRGAHELWQRRHAEFTAKARTAAANGDNVDAENFYQHAEHYLRMLQGNAAS